MGIRHGKNGMKTLLCTILAVKGTFIWVKKVDKVVDGVGYHKIDA